MLIGYLRGFPDEQNLHAQRQALEEAGCARIFEDHVIGTRSERPALQSVLDILQGGDTLMVWRLDRLGCSTKELSVTLRLLDQRGIHFRSLLDDIDTEWPSGQHFFHLMHALWRMERELTAERSRAGLATARRQGRAAGRKRLMTEKKIDRGKRLLARGVSPREVAETLQVSIPTLYRWLPATVRLSEAAQIEVGGEPGEILDTGNLRKDGGACG